MAQTRCQCLTAWALASEFSLMEFNAIGAMGSEESRGLARMESRNCGEESDLRSFSSLSNSHFEKESFPYPIEISIGKKQNDDILLTLCQNHKM
jgi:hypothetical protein